jgi:hypothetical protein
MYVQVANTVDSFTLTTRVGTILISSRDISIVLSQTTASAAYCGHYSN